MRRNDAKRKRQKKYHVRNHNNGFTLVEMVVTLVILSILLSLSVAGLIAWQDWANFNRQNEYAQILYIAAQNQLAEFGADGRLAELQESLSGGFPEDKAGKQYDAVGLNLTDSISLLRNSEGEAYSLALIYPESKDKQKENLYQDEIVALRAETGEYAKYLEDPEGLKASDPEAYWVFELLGAYVYDTSILNGSRQSDGSGNGAAICVEITPENGQVFSVLYSDLNDRFIYLGVSEEQDGNAEGNGVADIADRTENYRRERMVGYYGVDTLYAATKNEIIQPSLTRVKLYNKETFYMTCRLSAKYREILTSQLIYVMDLDASKDVNDKKLTLKLDGTKLKNEQNAEEINCPVSRYDADGREIELGEFPVLAWVEEDYTIHVVLDAADVQATTDLYEKELDDIRSDDKASDTKFAKTYSFFRFGVEADNVYASVTAMGDGFTTSKTISNFGNLNVFKNQEAKHTVFAGEKEQENGSGTEFTYSVMNARHLYNIRYIEDLSYEGEAGSVEAAERIAGVTFILKADIDWQKFERDGHLYNSYDTTGNFRLSSLNDLLVDAEGNVIENVTRYNCDFPSFSQVRERDVIDGNHKTITGISVSEISNALYGIYFSNIAGTDEMDDNRPTGFVNSNYGTIKDLKLDGITASGFDFVGGFCGINAGRVSGLETMNTDGVSLIAGRKHVGGIIGFQVPVEATLDIEGLTNHARVEGVEAVGGIMGMIRNEFHFSGIDLTELTGLSLQTRQLLENPSSLTVKIHDCENYGVIAGVNSSELREIYTTQAAERFAAGTSPARTGEADDPEEPRYIGGIVGYCYNQNDADITKITIEDCTSSPQYNSETLLSILSDETKLNRKMKGVYVGGIVGYNYFGQINNCSTKSQRGKEGCLFGYRYVGGIVGFNIGPASGIVGSNTSKQGENNNHVIAYEYAGGITGCNANVRAVDSENRDISAEGAKDPEKLEGILLPDAGRDLNVKIDNWVNKGIVIAVHEYSGGITGYNAGFIYRCNSEVKVAVADTYFSTLYSGNYSGGIAGYNNGVIGNTERTVSADGSSSTIVKVGDKFSTVCYVKGHHYVGGIVGYNDVDSIVEDYEIASGYVLGDEGSCFVGGYAGFNASVDLLMNMSADVREARFIHSNPNRVEGSYFVGGNIGGNIINMADNSHVDRIEGVFLTDNFLGILEGRAFVGGFVGYNLLFDGPAETDWIRDDGESYRGGVYIVQRELVDAFEKSDASSLSAEEALTEKKEILDHLPETLNLNIAASDKMVYISGRGAESTKISFGTISGDICVGGVLGYNDGNTKLYISNVENATPIEATMSIKYAEEQILSVDGNTGEKTYRETDYIGKEKTYTYSYAGGIIGKVSAQTTLDNCWNASTGTVTAKGTYTGGLCEVNEGIVQNCTVSSFGSSVQDYVGGLCGLNKNMIRDCVFKKKTVSGRNVVGGITAENFGTISNISLSGANLLVEGKDVDSKEKHGVAGIYTAYNGPSGKIILSTDIAEASITSGGRYVGLIAGINEGGVENKKTDPSSGTADNLVVDGTVRGYQTVGGLIGLNKDQDSSDVVEYYTNRALVIATNGNAGGIIGENLSGNSIRYCINDAVVTASDEGNAGGITSSNNSTITDCIDYKVVSAPEGMCGGITAVNKENGIIRNCHVEPKDGAAGLTFRSTKSVGGVAAQNFGEISRNFLNKVTVVNETSVLGTSIGVVVGDNLKSGVIYLADSSLGMDGIEDCEAIVQSNYCKVGGIAGTNAGKIKGTADDQTKAPASIVNCRITMDKATVASLGSVAGTNTGSIADIAVDAVIQGELGSSVTGYGGIAGYAGYTNKAELAEAQEACGGAEYPAVITNCSFDGIINAEGSSGAPVRVGGIVGINGYGAMVENCCIGARSAGIDGTVTEASGITYITAGDYQNKTAESVNTTDTKSYSYLGGIAGDNYGRISACDNQKNSIDTVKIIGFAGETGGIVGYNYAYGIVTGYLDEDGTTEHYLTTGEKWSVEQRCCGNDRGPGGIIGKSVSAEDISYVINYAPVTCNYKSNTYVAGLIGILEQQYALKTRFYKCENYGVITSYRSAGGFIGMLKGNGADFTECDNWGDVSAKTMYSGGFIGLHHTFVAGMDFRHCANHGNIVLVDNGSSVGGFVGNEAFGSNAVSYLYDCVNTGIINIEASTSVSDKAGNFYGVADSVVYMELCRNYDTNTSDANGFVGKGGNARYKNCLDNSNTRTRSKDKTPFGGTVGYNTNMFYLDSESERMFSHGNYGVYFSIHEGPYGNATFNGYSYSNQLRDPSYFLAEPDISNKIWLSNANPKLDISLTYDDDSQGLDSFAVYFWNGNYNVGSASQYTYYCTATYIYSDGTTETTGPESAQGCYDIVPESRVVLKNPSTDKKPVSIQLSFSGANTIYLRGFSFIPTAESAAGTEAVCTYLGKRNDTTFSIEEIQRTTSAGVVSTVNDFSYTRPADSWYRYINDALDIDWTAYTNYRLQYNAGDSADITIDVTNGENASGMDSFVFYLANDNTNVNASSTNIRTYYYDYAVTFTDINGNTITTEPVMDAAGYDSGETDYMQKSRQVVAVPEGFDHHISKIQLHIRETKYTYVDRNGNTKVNTSTGWIYFRGFGWIPEGQTVEQKMAAAAHSSALLSFYDRYNDSRNFFTDLKVDYSGSEPYVYIPYDYNLGFRMTYSGNDPIGNSYYGDQSGYSESLAAGEASGTRIATYLDFDPKFVALTEEICTVYKKLPTPENLTMTVANASLQFSWGRVQDAYGYELYYKVLDEGGNQLFVSDIISIGSMQLSYNIPIDNSWADNKNRIAFYVRAINGYHPAHDAENSDKDYEKYDSDWAGMENVEEKKALPKPKVHMEIVAGNRTTFVLDNYEEYVEEGCTDCTIVVQYNNKDYSWDVNKSGKYRIPEVIPAAQTILTYYAKPNQELQERYTTSAVYRQYGEGHGNNNLPNSDRYCSTSFYGFYGTEADSMEYQIVFTLSSLDTYLMTDISAYDEKVGATVVYDSEITHAANSYNGGGGSVKLTSTLKNLPKEWFASDNIDKITARAYPYHSQYDMIYYGHDVAEEIELNGTVEENRAILAGIYDSAYFAADADAPASNCIWDPETNDLKSGYLLQKQEDGTYNVIYSSVIELSQATAAEQGDPYREYYRYDVDYRIYSSMASETGDTVSGNSADFQESYWTRGLTDDNRYNNVVTDSNERKYVQEIQAAPIVETAVASSDENGHATYTFKWDTYYQDTACWDDGTNRYNRTENRYLTDPETGLFATWDAYSEKFNHAGLTNITDPNGSTFRDRWRRLMNAYYSSYSTASYRVDLIGTTLDGNEVILATTTVDDPTQLDEMTYIENADHTQTSLTTRDETMATTYRVWNYQCTFTDSNNTWNNYPQLTARIMRIASLSSVCSYGYNNGNLRTDKNSAVYILPRYTDTSILRKLKMNTISKPKVSLLKENGQFVTNDLVYEIEWGAITDEKQKRDLGGYLITVTLSTAADDAQRAQTHYYYVTDVGTAGDTIGIDLAALEANATVIDAGAYYTKSDNTCKTRINLSDFNTDDVVKISVKAVARAGAESYEDSADGIVTELTIPNRLKVPDTAKLAQSIAASGAPVTGTSIDMETYWGGLAFRYAVDDYTEVTDAEIAMAAAVYDTKPDGAENDNLAVTAGWDADAVKVLYTKDDALNLGKANEGNSVTINMTEFENYPGEYAGKWLKIALLATSATKIDSQWTDQDIAGRTTNYVWVQIPALVLNDVDLEELSDSDTGDVVRYELDGVIYNELQDVNRETPVATKTLSFSEDKNVDGYSIGIVGKAEEPDVAAPTYTLYLQRHLADAPDPADFDGTWDVYLAAETGVTGAPAFGDRPVCEQNAAAVWLGIIGSPFAADSAPGDTGGAVWLIELPDIGKEFTIVSTVYNMTAQLRYTKDAGSGNGSFLIVLPDLTVVGETPYSADDYFTTEVLVQQYVKAGTAYTAGQNGIYSRP